MCIFPPNEKKGNNSEKYQIKENMTLVLSLLCMAQCYKIITFTFIRTHNSIVKIVLPCKNVRTTKNIDMHIVANCKKSVAKHL